MGECAYGGRGELSKSCCCTCIFFASRCHHMIWFSTVDVLRGYHIYGCLFVVDQRSSTFAHFESAGCTAQAFPIYTKQYRLRPQTLPTHEEHNGVWLQLFPYSQNNNMTYPSPTNNNELMRRLHIPRGQTCEHHSASTNQVSKNMCCCCIA